MIKWRYRGLTLNLKKPLTPEIEALLKRRIDDALEEMSRKFKPILDALYKSPGDNR